MDLDHLSRRQIRKGKDFAENLRKAEIELREATPPTEPLAGNDVDPEASAEAMKAKLAAIDHGLDIPEWLHRAPKAAAS